MHIPWTGEGDGCASVIVSLEGVGGVAVGVVGLGHDGHRVQATVPEH